MPINNLHYRWRIHKCYCKKSSEFEATSKWMLLKSVSNSVNFSQMLYQLACFMLLGINNYNIFVGIGVLLLGITNTFSISNNQELFFLNCFLVNYVFCCQRPLSRYRPLWKHNTILILLFSLFYTFGDNTLPCIYSSHQGKVSQLIRIECIGLMKVYRAEKFSTLDRLQRIQHFDCALLRWYIYVYIQ